MKDLTLLILAAGMGSRFGGLKQIEPMGPNGEFIIDYSIYDAIKAGFNKVVFVIKRENEQIFKKTIGKRIEKKIKVLYAFQDMNNIPLGFKVPSERTKPWGTSHAVLVAKDLINEPFAIINADDFYGFEAYKKAANFLSSNHNQNNYCVIGYKVINTLSDNGAVKRGICFSKNNSLTSLVESKVLKENNIIKAYPLDESDSFTIEDDTLVSMNMFGFMPSIFKYLENNFSSFLEDNKNNILTCEYLVPNVVNKIIREEKVSVNVIKTDAKWLGITYLEDKEKVVKEINKLISNNIYPYHLWN